MFSADSVHYSRLATQREDASDGFASLVNVNHF